MRVDLVNSSLAGTCDFAAGNPVPYFQPRRLDVMPCGAGYARRELNHG